MNFKQQLRDTKTVTSNSEICALQAQYEGQAWSSPIVAQKLKNAVMWLRENPEATKQQAIEKFMN